MFGVGWGLAGICPGPALVLSVAGVKMAGAFTLAMIAGMIAFDVIERFRMQH